MTAPARVETCWGPVSLEMAAYHDGEWGIPCHDDHKLFEMLMLEGFQAGLSWATILVRRESFRRAFDDWDVERIAAYGPGDIARLMADPGIIRNRLKVEGAIKNARAFLEACEEHGAFDPYIWSFVGGRPLDRPAPESFEQVPATTPESDIMSRALKKRGFTFVGSTICYAFMQAVGMVNDHLASCPASGPGATGSG